MNKKKILLTYDYFDPAFKAGGPIQSCRNLVESLHLEYDFYIYTQNIDLDGEVLNVKTNLWLDYRGIAKVFYVSLKNKNIATVRKVCNDIKPDIIYINGIFSPHFIIDFLRVADKRQKIVIAPRGMLQKGALKIKALKKKVYLLMLKIFLKRKNISWHATDNQEMNDVLNFSPKKTCIAENIPNFNPSFEFHEVEKNSKNIFFTTISLIARKKNHIAFIEMLKKLEIADKISINYDIYGPIKDEEYLKEIEQSINKLPQNIKVRIKGALLPSRIEQTLQPYHFFVLPTFGENFGHAIFEALQSYTPVLISNKTPWLELEKYNAGWDLELNDEYSWLQAISTIVNLNQEDYNKLCMGARELANGYIVNSNFIKKYEDLFQI